ncbi:MAG: TlpA disulfide reductase family protein, partial [Bacteroidales bacterium]
GDLSNMSKLQILGGKEQKIYNGLQAELMEFDYQLNLIEEDYNRASKQYNAQDLLKKIEKSAEDLHRKKLACIKRYAQKNINSLAAVYLVSYHLAHLMDINELDFFVNAFEKGGLAREPMTMEMRATLNTVQRTSINHQAPNFSILSTRGDTITVDKYQGKYLFIDFWASWCKACRIANPRLVSLYYKYRNQGFDIISVSVDNEKAKWHKAIADDKLPWAQVSELKVWDGEISKLYNVSAIPSNFLLDTNGIIIHKNLKSDELGEILNNLMQK